jgi:hypothetical protein
MLSFVRYIRMKYLFGYIVFLFMAFTSLNAQLLNPGLDPFGNPLPLDTSSNEADTIINKNGFFSIFKGKPGKAALYGLLIPSGGQIYNKKWWKVPLALGVDGALTYVLIDNRQKYRKAQDLYLMALDTMIKPNLLAPRASQLREQRNYFRKWSEYAWIWLVGGHLLTVVDAYVDRQLMDFDVSPDLSWEHNPDSGTSIVLQTHVRVSLNAKKTEKQPIDFTPILWDMNQERHNTKSNP